MPLLTIAEASVKLNKSERTIHRMIKSGKLTTIESEGKLLIDFPEEHNPFASEVLQQEHWMKLESIYLQTIGRLEAENYRLLDILDRLLPPKEESNNSDKS